MQQSVRQQIRNQLRRRKFDKAINAMAENFFAYSVVFKTLMIPGYRNVPAALEVSPDERRKALEGVTLDE
jgi:hypothetical protein